MAARHSIRIGCKCKRGQTGSANPVIPGYTNIDVTSGSMKKINGTEIRFGLSPMFLGPVVIDGEEEAKIFECWWQGGKVFPDCGHCDDDHNTTDTWERFRLAEYAKTKGGRHPTGTKSSEFTETGGKRSFIYYKPAFGVYFGMHMDYITSRKMAYVPIFAQLVKTQSVFIDLKEQVDVGALFIILDIDGPRDGVHEVTVDFLRDRINDPNAPFGHGYVIAGLLMDIEPEEYCM